MAGKLAFWLANASEFCHLLKCDPDLLQFYKPSLESIIHSSLVQFTQCMFRDFKLLLPAIYSQYEQEFPEQKVFNSMQPNLTAAYWSSQPSLRAKKSTIKDFIMMLDSALSLLKEYHVHNYTCKVIFSALFQFISNQLLNKLLTNFKYCTKINGLRMKHRLERITKWAMSSNIKNVAEIHLSVIFQV